MAAAARRAAKGERRFARKRPDPREPSVSPFRYAAALRSPLAHPDPEGLDLIAVGGQLSAGGDGLQAAAVRPDDA